MITFREFSNIPGPESVGDKGEKHLKQPCRSFMDNKKLTQDGSRSISTHFKVNNYTCDSRYYCSPLS